MFGFGKLKFKGIDKKFINDEAHVEDYKSAEEIGRVRLGELCLYYRDLGTKYYVPYDYIERALCRTSEVSTEEIPGDYTYHRLVLIHGTKEFANLIFDKGDSVGDVKRIIDALELKNPAMERGPAPKNK